VAFVLVASLRLPTTADRLLVVKRSNAASVLASIPHFKNRKDIVDFGVLARLCPG